MFEVDQKVTVKHEVGDAPSGDSPGGLYAKPGEVLVIRKITDRFTYPIAVSHEHITDRSFGVTAEEIEAL
tara:strand:- start:318 stop:527 length:210 start_codon:yes stop_codon:yes gene_type:complete